MYLPFKFKRLDISFDAERLQNEVRSIPADWWHPHRFDGTGHDIVILVSRHGTLTNRDGSTNHSLLPPFLPTAHFRSLPYISQVLSSFGQAPSRSRLMRIGPGETLKAHQDRHPHWNNKVRVHIPVFTDRQVQFHVWSENASLREADHATVHMPPGEAWIFNNWYFHAVSNPSSRARIHLAVDVEITESMRDLVFAGCSIEQIEDCRAFMYPPYEGDPEVLRWAHGGQL
jgi:hypothetical protein